MNEQAKQIYDILRQLYLHGVARGREPYQDMLEGKDDELMTKDILHCAEQLLPFAVEGATQND